MEKLENLPLCRICLANDVRLYFIPRHLQDMYETITSLPFQSEDGRPLGACYVCLAKLWNSYELQLNCLQSEDRLTDITHRVHVGVLKPEDVISANSFGVSPVLHLSLGHENENSTEYNVKEEAQKVFYDAGPKDCGIVTKTQEEQYAKEVKLNIEDATLKEDVPKGNMNPAIVLERIDLNNHRTGVFVVKKLEETDSEVPIYKHETYLTQHINIHTSKIERDVCNKRFKSKQYLTPGQKFSVMFATKN